MSFHRLIRVRPFVIMRASLVNNLTAINYLLRPRARPAISAELTQRYGPNGHGTTGTLLRKMRETTDPYSLLGVAREDPVVYDDLRHVLKSELGITQTDVHAWLARYASHKARYGRQDVPEYEPSVRDAEDQLIELQSVAHSIHVHVP